MSRRAALAVVGAGLIVMLIWTILAALRAARTCCCWAC